MLGIFGAKKVEVLSHWYALVPDFNTSTRDLYVAIEKELKTRQVPNLQISRVEFAEGGLLSNNREYLRMTRERLVFDICGAPFGTAFFFSCRFAEIPAVVQLWQLLVLACALGFFAVFSFTIFVKVFGLLAPFLWPLACIAFLILAIYVMRNAAATGIKDLDATLLKIPVLNAVYAAWFRRETYYREDTRLMYCDTVNEVVKATVEEITGAKGIKLLRFNEHSPIFGDLYKPSTVQLPRSSAAT